MKKFSQEFIEERIKKIYGNEFLLLSEYKGVDFPITVKHRKCGHIYSPIAYNFFKGKGCSICLKNILNNSKRKKQKDFEKQVYEKYKDQFTVLGKYISCHTPIKVRHNYYYTSSGKKIICNHISMIPDPISFLKRNGRRSTCSYCKNKKHLIINNKKVKINDLYNFGIYKHVNKINNKVYIGVTSEVFCKRWSNGKKYIANEYFYNSIIKYGWENFDHYLYKNKRWIKVKEYENRILDYEYSFSEACELERKLIKKYRKKLGFNNVYNLSSGGEGFSKITTKRVLQYNLNGDFIKEYESSKIASLSTNINYSTIVMCCNNKIKTAGRYLWKYKDSNKKIIIPQKIDNRNVKVLQYDLDGKYLNTYKSIADASKKNNICDNSIFLCCHNRRKQAGNYQWQFITSSRKMEKVNKNSIRVREVLQYDLNGKFINKFNTLTEAINKFSNTSIGYSCRNKCITAGGYIWIYNDKNKIKSLKWHLNKLKTKGRNTWKKVYRYDLMGNFIDTYESAISASKILNIDVTFIYSVCSGRRLSCKKNIFLYERLDYKSEINRRITNLKKAHYIK